MKRFLFLIPVLFLFVSCFNPVHSDLWEYQLQNNSSYDLNINIGKDNYTLLSGNKLNVSVSSHDSINVLDNNRIIAEKTQSNFEPFIITYSDIKKYEITIFNPTTYDLLITEKDRLLGDTVDFTLDITSGNTVKCSIYTKNPKLEIKYKINGLQCDISNIAYEIN